MEVIPIGFADGLDVGYERKREVKISSMVFALSNRGNGIVFTGSEQTVGEAGFATINKEFEFIFREQKDRHV